MRIAIIANIHANRVALDAVLADIEALRPEQIVCLGDVAATGPQPRQAVERLRALGCPVVMGNADAWLLDPQPFETGAAPCVLSCIMWASPLYKREALC